MALAPAHGAHVGVVDGGDVVACLDAGLLRGRAVIDFQHLGVAGLVLGHLHADAHQRAVLDVQQLGVGVGGVVTGVPVAGAHQIAGGNGVVQQCLIDGVVVVAADIPVQLGDLAVHTLFFLDIADGAVEQPHRQQHGDRERHRHGQDHNGQHHADRDLLVHRWPSCQPNSISRVLPSMDKASSPRQHDAGDALEPLVLIRFHTFIPPLSMGSKNAQMGT